MKHRARVGVILVAVSAGVGLAAGQASAQDAVADFYRGKTLTIIAASAPGGGYDLYARTIARHIAKHLPGQPTVVVSNMPGAASNVAAAYIANVAPKDGTVMGAIFMGAVVEPLFGKGPRTTHDPSKFNYIGNANKDVYTCLVRGDAPVKSFADVFDKELVMGASADGASTRDFPELLKNLLGAKFRIVAGYPGTRQINLAMERGEVQGVCGQSWSSVSSNYPAWFKDGTINVLAQEDSQGYPDLNRQGVPRTVEFARTDEQRRILDLIYSQTAFGRPYIVAAGVPAERVAALRKAFMATMTDPELKAEAARIKLDIDAIGGDELQREIAKMYATPPDILEKARRAILPR
jgi:tripartite-type tricarboxylate transporter receptor subunit TctC